MSDVVFQKKEFRKAIFSQSQHDKTQRVLSATCMYSLLRQRAAWVEEWVGLNHGDASDCSRPFFSG